MFENDRDYHIEVDQRIVAFLRRFPERIDRESQRKRLEFLLSFCELVWRSPNGQPIDIARILHPEEIECLLSDSLHIRAPHYWRAENLFIAYVANSSYRADRAEIDPAGRRVSFGTTLVHHAVITNRRNLVESLMNLYRYDVTYVDEESGLTHYHIACEAGFSNVARFIEHGRDPNGLVLTGTMDSPLHLALDCGSYNVAAEILLRSGADPNSVNAKGETPLHVICKRRYNDELMRSFLAICDELDLRVQVNVRDNMGNTALQLAVNNLELNMVLCLGNRTGVDTSSLTFPSESVFDELVASYAHHRFELKWKLISIVFGLVEFLKVKNDYDLVTKDVLAIMKFFIKLGVYMTSVDLDPSVINSEQYRNKLEEVKVSGYLYLHDLFKLGVNAASRHFKYSEFLEIRDSFGYDQCGIYVRMKMCEIMMRGFFLSHAIEAFMQLTHFRLPCECCDIIMDQELTNNDLYIIFLATADESQRRNGEIDAMTNEIDHYDVRELLNPSCVP